MVKKINNNNKKSNLNVMKSLMNPLDPGPRLMCCLSPSRATLFLS